MGKKKYDEDGYPVPTGQGNRFWQAHALKEVCLEGMKGNDDEIKNILLDWWRQYIDSLEFKEISATSGGGGDPDKAAAVKRSKNRRKGKKSKNSKSKNGGTDNKNLSLPVPLLAMQMCKTLKQCPEEPQRGFEVAYNLFMDHSKPMKDVTQAMTDIEL